MTKQFHDRIPDKRYLAVVSPKPKDMSANLVHWLKKQMRQNRALISVREQEGYKKCILNYSCLGVIKNRALLEIELMTGRPHQIRAQLAAVGSPHLW